ncbi:unnamed protein product [Moneuplotes crassus]|uniref:Uncharacterized protein n=1 Tax=Euplotes crassus TaxID=5936 RepID=A0AAD2CXN3_EUPCR|nr:unnamed protein product [Moneuplotes crassus]
MIKDLDNAICDGENGLFLSEENLQEACNFSLGERDNYLDSTNLQLDTDERDGTSINQYPFQYEIPEVIACDDDHVEILLEEPIEIEQPAVLLVDEEEPSTKIPDLFLPPKEKIIKQEKVNTTNKKARFSITEFVQTTYNELEAKQKMVDQGCYTKKGPGRKRANPDRTSEELYTLLWDYMNTRLRKTCNKKLNRTDALTTEFVRICEKLPYYLVINCSSLSIYKKSSYTSFLFSFLESFTSFSSSLNSSNLDIVRSLAEYAMIFFPKTKCLQIIKLLKEENYEESFCSNLERMIALRDCTAKKSIRDFAQKSSILRKIFSLALKVLSHKSFPKNESSECLMRCAEYFINE